MNKEKLAKYSLYLWLLFWPWQIKLILLASESNYLEIYFFASWLLLIPALFVWGREIINNDYLRLKNNDRRPLWWWGLIIFEMAVIVSIFFADNNLLALFRYFIFALGLFLFHFLKSYHLPEKDFSKLFIIGLIFPSLLGIWQFFSQKTFAFKWLGLAEHSVNTLGTSVIDSSFGRCLRAYGSFDHPNVFGGVMLIALIYILYLSFKEEIKTNTRLFYLSTFSIFYCALLFSFSRSAILAFIISAPLTLIRVKKISKSLVVLYLILIIGISLAIIIPNKDLFLTRTSTSSRLEQKSLDERTSYFVQSLSIIKKNPILGVGAGNYTVAEKKLDNDSHAFWFYQPVHNYWLLLWSEIGIIGLSGALIFCFSWFTLSLRKNTWPLFLAILILSLFDHWLWTSPLGLMLFFMIAALTFKEEN